MYKDEALYLLKGGNEGILQWNRKVTAGKANLDLGGPSFRRPSSRGSGSWVPISERLT